MPFGPAEKVPHVIDSDPKVLEAMQGDAVEMARFILSRSGTAQERFQQSGELDARLRLATGLAKAPFVAAFTATLLESTPKVIMWGWHHAVYQVWQERLARNGIRSVKYTGEETQNQKQATLNAFMRDDGPQVLIMSLRSGAGIDGLQERCSVGVFGELDWSPKIMEQCAGRLARDGQEAQVLTYYLLARDGADPKMAEVLELKHQQATPIENPHAVVGASMPQVGNRVRLLAEDLLRQHGIDPDSLVPDGN